MFHFVQIIIALPILSLPVFAQGSPKIDFNKTVIDCGTIVDGSREKINAQFTVKNIGDAPLKIASVRPSCLCTIVKFDTLIMPGKTSILAAVVDITEYHSGPISKPVTVSSNAVNNPVVQLAIKANILPVIDVSEKFIDFYASQAGSIHTILISSTKKDLAIIAIDFVQNKKPDAKWQEQVPVSIKFSAKPEEKIRANGNRVLKLEMITPFSTEELRGVLHIKTNHPNKPDLIVQCVINK